MTAPKPGRGARSAESLAQEALDGHGYVVIGSTVILEVGAVVCIQTDPNPYYGINPSDGVAVITGIAEASDMDAQMSLWGLPRSIKRWRYYYKAVAE